MSPSGPSRQVAASSRSCGPVRTRPPPSLSCGRAECGGHSALCPDKARGHLLHPETAGSRPSQWTARTASRSHSISSSLTGNRFVNCSFSNYSVTQSWHPKVTASVLASSQTLPCHPGEPAFRSRLWPWDSLLHNRHRPHGHWGSPCQRTGSAGLTLPSDSTNTVSSYRVLVPS